MNQVYQRLGSQHIYIYICAGVMYRLEFVLIVDFTICVGVYSPALFLRRARRGGHDVDLIVARKYTVKFGRLVLAPVSLRAHVT